MSVGDLKPEPEKSPPAEEAGSIPLTPDLKRDNNNGSSNSNKNKYTENDGSTSSEGHIKGERQAKEIKKYGACVLVLDSAMSWVVCIAVAMSIFLMALFRSALTIYFLDFVEAFDVSITTASLGFTFGLVFTSITSVVGANLMVPYIGTRLVVLIGAVCNCVFTFGLIIAPNIAVFILFMTAKGFAFGLILTPSIALMSMYFNRRRSLATSIAFCGMGAGNMLGPPLFEVLKENFGLWGLFLVVAAIEMNGVPAAMLMRPIGRYKYIIKDGVDIKAPAKSEPTDDKDDATEQSPFLTQDEKVDEDLSETDQNNLSFSKPPGKCDEKLNHCGLKEWRDVPIEGSKEENAPEKLPENKSMNSTSSSDAALSTEAVARSRENSFAHPSEARTAADVSSAGEEAGKRCLTKTGAFFQRLFNVDLFDLWSMWLLMGASGLGALVQYLMTYLPTISIKQGLTQPEVAVLMTINGSLELVSRIVIGIFSDFHLLTNCQIVTITHVVIGTVLHFNYFYTSYNALLFLVVVSGALSATQQNLSSLLTIEILGMENLLSAFGFRIMISTLVLATHHPLLGFILESTGSFAAPLHYVGMCLYMAAVLLLMAPMVKRYDARRKAATSEQPKL
ncbi:monocarboxylate transporter [Plakobranchus ocellatus]|uniref:Monocarboxylate transporter n=1 Tax=Plakobranchus ocellatus TaxID=259542 RepID=A0AAV4AGD2_9GAST|nr:monocarboxylate transporter [Plakobranchus ocellatus]